MLWLVLFALVALYYYLNEKLKHFERLGVPHIKPKLFVGNMGAVFLRQKSFADQILEYYEHFKDERYFGIYNFMTPQIIVRDPELIKEIAIKNFDSFTDHAAFVLADVDKMFASNIFQLKGNKWRETRALLSPIFTGSKMRGMFNLVNETAKDFNDYLTSNISMNRDVDMKDAFGRYTTDVIASVAYGVKVNSLKDRSNDFYIIGKDSLNFGGYKTLIFFLNKMVPFVMRCLGIRLFPKKSEEFFKQVVSVNVETREKQGIVRPDMLQLMIQANKSSKGVKLSIDEMTAQAFVFFFGGFDTTSSTMCFAAHELAYNPSIQQKLSQEIKDNYEKIKNKDNGYDAIGALSYLDAVLRETLRLYQQFSLVDRVCTKAFQLPPPHPGAKEVTVSPGDTMGFPLQAIHRDPLHYSQSNEFIPERFLQDDGTISKEMLDAPHYLPFGLGPRICIGIKFALMEMKLVLFHLLATCELIPSHRTEYPVKFSKDSLLLAAENGFWLRLKTREGT